MWTGWIESNFRNPTVKIWANLDNPLKRTYYAKFCMSLSLDGTLPESVIPQENNSHWLCTYFFSSWISIVRSIKFNHKCMHNHLSPNVRKYKSRGNTYIFIKSQIFEICIRSSIRQLYCCDITDCSRVPPERAAYKKFIKTLENHTSWLDYPNLPKLLLLGF